MAVPKKFQTRGRRFAVERLRTPAVHRGFKLELRNQFEALADLDEQNMDQHLDSINGVLLTAAENVVGYREVGRKAWITDESWKLVEERRELKARINTARDSYRKLSAQRVYADKSRQVKRSIRRDRRNMVEQLAGRAEEAAQRNDSKELYRITKQLAGKKTWGTKPVKDKHGRMLTTEDEQLLRWEDYFKGLLYEENWEVDELNVTPEGPPGEGEDLGIDTSPPTRAEIVAAIKSLKNGKAPGADNINAELLKVDPEATADALLPLFLKIWDEERIPELWKRGIIVKFPKKGDVTE